MHSEIVIEYNSLMITVDSHHRFTIRNKNDTHFTIINRNDTPFTVIDMNDTPLPIGLIDIYNGESVT